MVAKHHESKSKKPPKLSTKSNKFNAFADKLLRKKQQEAQEEKEKKAAQKNQTKPSEKAPLIQADDRIKKRRRGFFCFCSCSNEDS